MTVGLIIITHSDIGKPMLQTACTMIDACPLQVAVLEIPLDHDTESLYLKARAELQKLETGEGVLVLTDMYGSTPSNIASRLNEDHNIRIVTGLNLPMLVRVFNYANQTLDELAEKAMSGGQLGIVNVE